MRRHAVTDAGAKISQMIKKIITLWNLYTHWDTVVPCKILLGWWWNRKNIYLSVTGISLLLTFVIFSGFIYEDHLISFQPFFVWELLLILHTWNSSPSRSNLLRLQCTFCTAPTTPMEVLLCEHVNDLHHSIFHLFNCLITTASGLKE